MSKIRRCLKQSRLMILTLLGVTLGLALGFILRAVKETWSPREVMYIKFVGQLYLRGITAIMLPLIVSSLIAAVGSLDIKLGKRIGIYAVVYYMTTTFIAAITGLTLAMVIRPGKSDRQEDDVGTCQKADQKVRVADSLMDIIRNMFPPNLVEAAIKSSHTVEIQNDSIPADLWEVETRLVDGQNLIGLVVFSVALGIVLANLRDKGKALLAVCVSLFEATLTLTSYITWCAPVAVLSLVAGQLVERKEVDIFKGLGWYVATLMIGYAIHCIIVLPGIYFLLTKSNPYTFIVNMSSALATAFGIDSSAATLPVTIHCLETKNHVHQNVSRFLLPIGTTINMDGNALSKPIQAIYLAQICGLDLQFSQLISLTIVAIAASIATAAVSTGGTEGAALLATLAAIGVPEEYIVYILPVGWILARFTTVTNVLGDAIGAGIINHRCRSVLKKMACLKSGTVSSEEIV